MYCIYVYSYFVGLPDREEEEGEERLCNKMICRSENNSSHETNVLANN